MRDYLGFLLGLIGCFEWHGMAQGSLTWDLTMMTMNTLAGKTGRKGELYCSLVV